MAAIVVVEFEVVDADAKDSYSKAAGPVVKAFGGEFLAAGQWTQLSGQPGLKLGAIIRFEDRQQALAWYHSPEYQSLLVDRDKGMVSSFRVI